MMRAILPDIANDGISPLNRSVIGRPRAEFHSAELPPELPNILYRMGSTLCRPVFYVSGGLLLRVI